MTNQTKKTKLSEKEKQRLHAESKFRNDLKRDFDNFDSIYETNKKELTKRWGFEPKEGDLLWGTAQRLLMDAMKKGDWGSMFSIYFGQALYIHNSGKNSQKYQQIIYDLELQNKKDGLINKVQISSVKGQSCSACNKLDGKVFTVEEALKMHPLPNKKCSFKFNSNAPTGWCRCAYLPVVN